MNAFRICLGASIALAALSIAAVADAQQVYSWKDAKGVTHYSDSPPPAGATKIAMHAASKLPCEAAMIA